MRTRSLLPLGIILLLGCGGPKLAPVSGVVTLDHQPLANAVVMFQPTGEGQPDPRNPGPGSTGRTNEQGEYSLTMIGGGKGAVVGMHKVEIKPVVEGNPNPPRVTRYDKGDLVREVKPGGNTFNFELTSK